MVSGRKTNERPETAETGRTGPPSNTGKRPRDQRTKGRTDGLTTKHTKATKGGGGTTFCSRAAAKTGSSASSAKSAVKIAELFGKASARRGFGLIRGERPRLQEIEPRHVDPFRAFGVFRGKPVCWFSTYCRSSVRPSLGPLVVWSLGPFPSVPWATQLAACRKSERPDF